MTKSFHTIFIYSCTKSFTNSVNMCYMSIFVSDIVQETGDAVVHEKIIFCVCAFLQGGVTGVEMGGEEIIRSEYKSSAISKEKKLMKFDEMEE